MYVESFKNLKVWQRAMSLALETYAVTKLLPKDELYSLSSQMRRAAVSIPSNIAEGKKRRTTANFVQFLDTADGSAAELETQFLLLKRLYPHIATEKGMTLLEEVQKMLAVMIKKLEPSLKAKS